MRRACNTPTTSCTTSTIPRLSRTIPPLLVLHDLHAFALNDEHRRQLQHWLRQWLTHGPAQCRPEFWVRTPPHIAAARHRRLKIRRLADRRRTRTRRQDTAIWHADSTRPLNGRNGETHPGGKDAAHEHGVADEIAPPEPPWLAHQPEQPLDAQPPEELWRPRHIIREKVEERAHRQTHRHAQIGEMLRDPDFLRRHSQRHQQNIWLRGVDARDNLRAVLRREEAVLHTSDAQRGKALYKRLRRLVRHAGLRTEQKD